MEEVSEDTDIVQPSATLSPEEQLLERTHIEYEEMNPLKKTYINKDDLCI